MFRTISGSADPRDVSEPVNEKPKSHDGVADSCASTRSDHDAIEHIPGSAEEHEEGDGGNAPARPSKELKRTTSNALARVSSRLTTRSLPDPGPPPDGGWKAWTQIAAGWIAIFTTWGWINCFGTNRLSIREPTLADIVRPTGVFQTYYTSTLDVSPSVISWIGTVQNFLTFVLGGLSGRLLVGVRVVQCLIHLLTLLPINLGCWLLPSRRSCGRYPPSSQHFFDEHFYKVLAIATYPRRSMRHWWRLVLHALHWCDGNVVLQKALLRHGLRING
jgi:hypothetical protein